MLFFLAPVWVSLKSYFRRPVSVSETSAQVQDGLSGLLCTRKSNVRPPDSDSEERCWDRRTGSGAGCGVQPPPTVSTTARVLTPEENNHLTLDTRPGHQETRCRVRVQPLLQFAIFLVLHHPFQPMRGPDCTHLTNQRPLVCTWVDGSLCTPGSCLESGSEVTHPASGDSARPRMATKSRVCSRQFVFSRIYEADHCVYDNCSLIINKSEILLRQINRPGV